MIKILQNNNHQYFFIVKSKNGGVLMESKVFGSEDLLKKTIESISNNISFSIERKTNYEGDFLFLLKDSHGSTIGTSKSYASEAGMENGIKNLRRYILGIE